MIKNELWCAERKIYSRGSSDDRESWLAARRLHLTASDVASVAGIGMRSRNEVMKEKLENGSTEREAKIHGMAQVEAGRYLESGIVKWFGDQHLGMTAQCGELLYREGPYSWLAATPDALWEVDAIDFNQVRDGIPVEVKNIDAGSQWQWGVETTLRDGWPDFLPFPLPYATHGNWALQTSKVAAKWEGTPVGEWREWAAYRLTNLLPLLGAPCAPVKYVAQAYVQAYVMARREFVITACIGGTSRLDLHYTVHGGTAAWLFEQASEFWAEYQNRRVT